MAKQWTKELDDALTTMHGAGMTAKEIGSIMDRTSGAIGQRAFNLGITKKRRVALPIHPPVYDVINVITSEANMPQHEPTLLERMFSKLLGR
jgi:hypothetical protein